MPRKLVLPLLLFPLLLLPTSASSQELQELPSQVQDVVTDFDGEIYFAAKDLSNGRFLGYRADDQVKTASVIKVAIMAEAFAQARSGKNSKGVSVANKSGALNQVRNDVAIVSIGDRDFILSLFAQQSRDEKWTPDNAASLALAKLALTLLETLRQHHPSEPPGSAPIPAGAGQAGKEVSAMLQHTEPRDSRPR